MADQVDFTAPRRKPGGFVVRGGLGSRTELAEFNRPSSGHEKVGRRLSIAIKKLPTRTTFLQPARKDTPTTPRRNTRTRQTSPADGAKHTGFTGHDRREIVSDTRRNSQPIR